MSKPSHEPELMLDCAEAIPWLRKRMDASVDLVVIDPAYESQEGHRAIGTTTRLQTWFDVVSYDYLGEVAAELYRVLKAKRHCYVFADIHAAVELVPRFKAAGFHFWGAPVWDKVKMGTGYHYRRSTELVLFFEKRAKSGKGRALNDAKSVRDLFSVPLETPDHRKRYPAEKPLPLVELLVSQSSAPGEVVLDCFMGRACPTGVVSKRLGRVFWGCDKMYQAVDCAKAEVWRVLHKAQQVEMFAQAPPTTSLEAVGHPVLAEGEYAYKVAPVFATGVMVPRPFDLGQEALDDVAAMYGVPVPPPELAASAVEEDISAAHYERRCEGPGKCEWCDFPPEPAICPF